MSEHRAKLIWKRETSDFTYETYDRTHAITFEGGISIKASAAKQFAGKEEYVNPEEMLAASVASCHMLTFLAIAAKSRLVVDHYEDEPVAILGKNEEGKMTVVKIILQPQVRFAQEKPSPEKLNTLHEKAHHNCFIANSVKCPVEIEAKWLGVFEASDPKINITFCYN